MHPGNVKVQYLWIEYRYRFSTQAGVMAGVREGENAPASFSSLTFLGMCALLCVTVYLF